MSTNEYLLPDALHALVIPVQLGVELVEVGDGGEDDADPIVRLAVQLLYKYLHTVKLLLYSTCSNSNHRKKNQ